MLDSPAKREGPAFKPGFLKTYVKPVVAVSKAAREEDKGEGSSTPHIKPKAAFTPVLDYKAKGAFVLP